MKQFSLCKNRLRKVRIKICPVVSAPAKISRPQTPRKCDFDEAVMFRGKDGFVYKLEAPGKLKKVGGAKTTAIKRPVMD